MTGHERRANVVVGHFNVLFVFVTYPVYHVGGP